jgi:hypothetical protein
VFCRIAEVKPADFLFLVVAVLVSVLTEYALFTTWAKEKIVEIQFINIKITTNKKIFLNNKLFFIIPESIWKFFARFSD